MAIDWKERDLTIERRLAEFEAKAQERREEAARKVEQEAAAAQRKASQEAMAAEAAQPEVVVEEEVETPDSDMSLVHPNDPNYTSDPDSDSWAGMVTGGPAYSGEESEADEEEPQRKKSYWADISHLDKRYAEVAKGKKLATHVGEVTEEQYRAALRVPSPVRFQLGGTPAMREARYRNPKYREYLLAQNQIKQYEAAIVSKSREGTPLPALFKEHRAPSPLGLKWGSYVRNARLPEWLLPPHVTQSDEFKAYKKSKQQALAAPSAALKAARAKGNSDEPFTDVEGLTEQFRRTTEEGYGGPPPSYEDRIDTKGDYEKSLESASEGAAVAEDAERPYKKAVEAYIGPMQKIESFGGKSDASNPISSAYGASQFTKGTWMDMIKKYRPDLVEGRTKEEVLAMRSNYKLDYEMVTRFTEENAAKLDRLGHPLTRRNLYLMHFAGSNAAPKLLKAPEGDKASNYVSSKSQKSNPSVFWYGERKKDKNGKTVYYYEGKQKYPVWIHAHNPPKYKSVKEVLDWAENKMG